MDLRLSPAQEAFRAEVRAFIEERLPEDIRARLRAGHPAQKEDTVTWQRILNERGWAAPHWPRKFGGAELGQLERLILLDEMFRAPTPLPQVFNVTMLGPVLMKFGTPEQCEYFLPKLANLDLWFCQGFSEPGSGSDLASLRTAAKRDGDHYVVNGQKIWTTTAHWADWVFALVRTNPEAKKQEGISFLLIDLKSPGITIRPIRSIDGDHHLNEVFFDDVRVPVENLVGEENKGWNCAKFLLGNERTGIANVGLCRERLDYARELADRTVQGENRLIDDPKLRSEIATLDAEVRALEVTNWRFLLTPNEQARIPAFASVLKLKGVELQQDINALLARLAGPQGLEKRGKRDTDRGPLTPRYFYSRAASIYGGTSEVQKDILAKAIVG
ncbi:acyl-CoA dehydrogenase family protein [Cupriavidus metallidurans]|uniref:Acyl-CoA dehydrogenase putative medium-chain acyl-CoA dehydrogenase n=1 Tax=Cupriavidus metallidurans (strain ATCC 43123 / DSM 2839 / NBRC 102507 / CH34) TaxID=266264 RepID=Q1LBT7_CUPMC|nr:acyl-CoA dehydrogenase family protein [Cupriavidus metallidurans]ABF12389.1 acyl-CoA dehydrogenase; putative medium-chain acyl-CoA dehydrogenase [Cupriavidus metallidurans CH34]QGS32381.1 acyl-CoA dehydrogenase [Cupriavidus metallidurans]